ncbi:hypothetical protein SLS62_007688 [Diatrype stigma]|uniref:Uncharacterized protein n=1 Tax=Diatrype stigma TaxID=117547 RepID=A0AAN9UWA0_9PEZI
MVFEFDPGVRVQALTLHAEGASRAKITEKTGYSTSAFTVLLRKAKTRGRKRRKKANRYKTRLAMRLVDLIKESNAVPLQQNATPDVAYIFSPHDGTVDLLALNISASLQASSVSLQTLSSDLPFLTDGGSSTAFSASLADNGSIVVYAGDCSSASGSSIWTFSPSSLSSDEGAVNSPSSSLSSPTWLQQDTAADPNIDTDIAVNQTGPGFLGGSLSFSTTLEPQMSRASVYVYGGMCPNSSVQADTAQSNATYSNHMLRIAPSDSDSGSEESSVKADTGGYVVSPITSKGPPVPEAGFTLTGLSPSIANRSGLVTQQINYVLLGGHTRNAFINMSTVALWSLPEESWGFVSGIEIGSGSGSTSTELAVKKSDSSASSYSSIDSRSGHTAVLSEDGASLVVLGGWVGDTTQAASPQLAVLEIGAGYGGDGDWQWSVPPEEAQPSGPGIYGHGAALLPGNVMMVYGGYSIEGSSSGSKAKRQQSSNIPMFLNLTSLTWSDDYTNPSSTTTGGTPSSPDNSNDSDQEGEEEEEDKKKRLGFGLGLGLGLAAIIAAVLIYLWYRRRLRLHRRTIRNSALQALAQDDSHFIHDHDEMAERGGGSSSGAFPWYAGGPDPFGRGGGGGGYSSGTLGYKSLRSGGGGRGGSMDVDRGIGPWQCSGPPQSGGRRKLVSPRAAAMAAAAASRGQYQPTPTGNYDSPPPSGSRGLGPIHPIYEADEETSIHDGDGDGDIAREPLSPVRDGGDEKTAVEPDRGRDRDRDRDSAQYSDPFATPTQERSPMSFAPPSIPATTGAAAAIGGNGRASATPSPDRDRDRDRVLRRSTTDPEVQDWMTDVDAADALLSSHMAANNNNNNPTISQQQRPSPTRRNTDKSTRSLGAYFGGSTGTGGGGDGDESRTGSNISESNRSGLTPSRSGSVREVLAAALRSPIGFGISAAAAAAAGEEKRGGTAGSGGEKSEGENSQSSSAPSYNTARSSFHALQAEGPSLLLGGNGNGGNRDRDRNQDEDDEYYYGTVPGSPSKSKPRRSGGWLGSLRRVFSGPSPSPSPPGSHAEGSPRRESFLATEANDFDVARLGGLGSIAAGGLLRRKGGRGAWENSSGGDGGGGGESSGQTTMMSGGLGGGDTSARREGGEDDDEWDIEKAIERRLVQVMFTVPKDRLRVVNCEPDIDDALSGVLVNPGDEEGGDDDDDDDDDEGGANINDDEKRGLMASAIPRHSEKGQGEESQHRRPSGGDEQPTRITITSPERDGEAGDDPEKEELRREVRTDFQQEERDIAEMAGGSREGRGEDWDSNDSSTQRKKKKRPSRLSALEQEIDLLGAELEAQRDRQASSISGFSSLSSRGGSDNSYNNDNNDDDDDNSNHSHSNRNSNYNSDVKSDADDGHVFSAEAVHYGRPTLTLTPVPILSPIRTRTQSQSPRSRVLQMVESIETLSRENSPSPVHSSPSPSPTRMRPRTPGAVLPSKGK